MENNRMFLVRKYATAFVNVFGAGITQADISNIQQCAQKLDSVPNLSFFLQLTSLSEELKKEALKKIIITQCGLPSYYSSLIDLLIAHKRSFLITPIMFKIHKLAMRKQGFALFNISSSSELSQDQKTTILHFLEQKTGLHILADYTTDTKLIAGVRMQSSTFLWEQSVRKYLAEVELSLIR